MPSLIIVMMLKELSKNFNSIKKDMKNIKRNQSEMEDTVTKIKNIK